MSTNAILAYLNTQGTVTTTYVHWDGYIEYTGQMLADYYNDGVGAFNICRAGYLSSIEPTLERSLSDSANKCEPDTYDSIEQMLDSLKDDIGIEYIYIWTIDGKWVVLSNRHYVYSIDISNNQVTA